MFPTPKSPPAAARRFLEQAAFGPTPNDAATVQTLGFQQWIANQFAMPQVSNYNIITGDQGGMPTHFLTNAVSNPDQLRQRVAFALSQIFVTSIQKLIWNTNMVPYQNTLLSDGFTNYRQIMEDVTLSPAMGQYLDMGNNAMANPATGAVANENYARELMQLFTIGTVMLNQDGSPQLDSSGIPIPTYSQFTVTEFARVYTGWTYAPPPASRSNGVHTTAPATWSPIRLSTTAAPSNCSTPLSTQSASPRSRISTPPSKTSSTTPTSAHSSAKCSSNIWVKSNPSPAYISRVAAAFNNDGSGTRGNMQAVISAILLDPEARANDQGGDDQPTDGHLQEPALFMAGVVRAFGGQMNDQNYYASELANMKQDVFSSPSVFNYYQPNYEVPGTTATSGGTLMGGEFQIYSPNAAIVRANEISYLFANWGGSVETYGPGTTVDITPFLPLASNPTTLVNALDLTLTHGTMPAAMKSAIVTAVTANTSGNLRQVQRSLLPHPYLQLLQRLALSIF